MYNTHQLELLQPLQFIRLRARLILFQTNFGATDFKGEFYVYY